MNRKATFAVKNTKPNSSAHNKRLSVPKYLIETDPAFDQNYYEIMDQYVNDRQYKALAKKIYKDKIKQKMQEKQVKSLIKETVITATEEHTEADIKELFESLHEMMNGGYHLLELAGHFDEGHFKRIEKGWENLTYYPSKDILLKSDGKWYIKSNELIESNNEEDFDQLANMEMFEKVLNIHWHAKFTHMNLETGKTTRFSKGQVSGAGRLKFVADFLGLRYEPRSKIHGSQSVGSVKEKYHAQRQEKYRQIQAKHCMTMKNEQERKKAAGELKASMANHKEDANAAFAINVEYQAEKRENIWREEYINELEGEIDVYKSKNEDLFSLLNIILKRTGYDDIKSDEDIEKLKKSLEGDSVSREIKKTGISSLINTKMSETVSDENIALVNTKVI